MPSPSFLKSFIDGFLIAIDLIDKIKPKCKVCGKELDSYDKKYCGLICRAKSFMD